jgi:Ni/Fe-hydrogenase 1 B-type cytochrome subunit
MLITPDFKRVYIWELPVRFTHWLNVLTIFILICTGIIIGNPPAIMSGSEASHSYWFGTVRFIHFMTAYIFAANLVFRLYWAFVGNKYANWRAFFPFSRKNFKKIKHVFKVDVFLRNDKTEDLTNIAVGHNPVAALSYLALFFLCFVQIATGFALYASTASWFLPKMFGWVNGLFGGEFMVRSIHHIVTWVLVMFTLIHIYLVIYHDWLEGRGEASSMFGGYKFVRKDRLREKVFESKNGDDKGHAEVNVEKEVLDT